MIKMVCDRCGKEIEGTTYYTVSIHCEDINPKTNYRVYTDTTTLELSTSMMLLNTQPQYCKKCKDDIQAFISNV